MNPTRVLFVLLLLSIASPVAAQDAGSVLVDPLPGTVSSVQNGDRVPAMPVVSRATRARLMRELRARRELNLRRFGAYHRAGVFPDNHVQPGMLNVFIDDEGHICAAANLVALDGLRGLVEDQSRTDNYVRLVDVHDGALYEWMLMSGFTQEEIGQIQEPYAFIPDEPYVEPLEEQEKERLQQQLLAVEQMLRRDERASLAIALDRLIAHRFANGLPIDAAVSPASIAMRPSTVPPVAGVIVDHLPSAVVWRPGMANGVSAAPAYVAERLPSAVVWRPGMALPDAT
jgi:hypothetical protein